MAARLNSLMAAQFLPKALVLALPFSWIPSSVRAQEHGDSGNAPATREALTLRIGSETEDRERVAQLTQHLSTDGFLLRSLSSRSVTLDGDNTTLRWGLVPPEFQVIWNSNLPYSANDGALWAGRGMNFRLSGGFRTERGRVRIILAPDFLYSQNREFKLVQRLSDSAYVPPPLPPYRSPWSYPWRVHPLSIDYPLRFGSSRLTRLDAGQSSLVVQIGALETGLANENQWWGPGIRNALILSDNAPGFPHFFLRTGRPISTRIGAIEGRWLVGGLTESAFFDTVSSNDLRSLSALGLTWSPKWTPDLTVGLARAVYEAADRWGDLPQRLFNVFKNTGRPDDVPDTTSTTAVGADQLTSLFARWLFPDDGFEVYLEWARASFPKNLREFLLTPNHSQGYTIGVQYAREAFNEDNLFRIQGEVSFLEHSSTMRDQPIGSWYTSHVVPQGYTQRGQPLGASIGPGASSQFLALDYLARDWSFGVFASRIRWDNDSHDTIEWTPGKGWCEEDVSLLPGLRGAANRAWGRVSAEWTVGYRRNVFFDNHTVCPFAADPRYQRNRTVVITFSPPTRPR